MKECASGSVPLVTLLPEVIDRERQLSSKLVEVLGSVQITGRAVDYHALGTLERVLVDNGDLPPSWAYWWLTLAAELCCNTWSAGAALIIPNGQSGAQSTIKTWLGLGAPSYQILPMMVGDVCSMLGSAAWSSPAEVALAWGVDGYYFNHPVIPLPCRGAVIPVIDGLGALCISTDEDRGALSAWIENE